jgi:hypothetical protein
LEEEEWVYWCGVTGRRISEKVNERRMDMDMSSMMNGYGNKKDDRNHQEIAKIIHLISRWRKMEERVEMIDRRG